MKKLICILTVAMMLFSLSAGTVAALSPESTTCTDSSDSNLNTSSFKSVYEYVFNLDLKALFDRFLKLFDSEATDTVPQTEAAESDLTAAVEPCDPTLPAVSAANSSADCPSGTAATTTETTPATEAVKASTPTQTAAATETPKTSCGSTENTCTPSNSCTQAACPKSGTQCDTNACTQNKDCNGNTASSGSNTCTQYGVNGNLSDLCSGLLEKYGVKIYGSNSSTGSSANCNSGSNANSNTSGTGNSTAEPQSPASTTTQNTGTGTNTQSSEGSAQTPASGSSIDNLSFEQQVVTLVNEQRAANGLAGLTLNESLSNVARIKSQDMHDNNYFSHTSPTYGSPFDMLKTFGISYRAAGENIAMGYQTPQAVVDGWMNSPGHRANILNSSYTQIGVGYVADGSYWTQEFIG